MRQFWIEVGSGVDFRENRSEEVVESVANLLIRTKQFCIVGDNVRNKIAFRASFFEQGEYVSIITRRKNMFLLNDSFVGKH